MNIPTPTQSTRSAHQRAVETKKQFDDQLDAQRNADWRTVYREAEQVAKAFNQQTRRELNAADVINEWYLDLENPSQTNRDARKDDKVCEFLTISQELAKHNADEQRLAYSLWEREFRKWYMSGKQGIKPRLPKVQRMAIVQWEDHEVYGEGAWSEVEDDVASSEALRESKEGFFQSECEDPENPLEDAYGCKRMAVRHTANGTRRMYRGSKGVLGGVYSNTDPEPTYRTPQGRNRLLRTLLRSDNEIDVLQAQGMMRTLRFDAKRKAKSNSNRT